jgi:serralysin
VLIGGFGADTMTGGVGFDTFDFNSAGESPPVAGNHDHITDFVGNGAAAGDVIDVSTIDANTNVAGNQVFGGLFAAFTANSLSYNAALDLLQGDTDGNLATVEFEVHFLNNPNVIGADIIF